MQAFNSDYLFNSSPCLENIFLYQHFCFINWAVCLLVWLVVLVSFFGTHFTLLLGLTKWWKIFTVERLAASIYFSQHKKWSFPLRISLVNVTKSVGNCWFGHIYWRNPQWKTSFFVQCSLFYYIKSWTKAPFFLAVKLLGF